MAEVKVASQPNAPPGALAGGWRATFLRWFALPGAAVAALLIGALIILALGANRLTGYHALVTGGFAGPNALTSTAVKAVPLLLVGVGICIAFRANVLNIGGEGQIAMGGLASTATALALPNLPSIVLIPVVLLAGAAGGAAWGAIPGLFKAYRNVNEVLSTIMLNLVAIQLVNYLLSGPMIDRSESFAVVGRIPQTRLLSHNSWLPILIPGTQFHLGVVIAVLAAIGAWVLLSRTSFGFRLRAVGLSTEASTYAGMPVKRAITLRELARRPKVLLVAQPTRGIDVGSAQYIHQRLIGQPDAGTAVVVISEDLDEAMSISDRILVMYEGHIVGGADPRTTGRETIGLLMAGTPALDSPAAGR